MPRYFSNILLDDIGTGSESKSVPNYDRSYQPKLEDPTDPEHWQIPIFMPLTKNLKENLTIPEGLSSQNRGSHRMALE
jgi:hypothetical protein